MKRFTFLLFIALTTFLIVLWVKRPDIISNFWLWLVGLAGPIVALYKRLMHSITESDFYKKLFHQPEPANTNKNNVKL